MIPCSLNTLLSPPYLSRDIINSASQSSTKIGQCTHCHPVRHILVLYCSKLRQR
ncbi:unnamed protein product [Tuber melanosporum]|uniref:(Perigord truffle) hypothetical protein n=1 Tax=Tuber melanosporum (strain Mel28) TaxID=656061 RepID=D5GMQ9_TUBMM|nr:uncharacterized protein GSTUM_00010890001 [Tuber melanosporum]CAZ85802.1 unnamed protein product [Tuber melanosporum]